MLFSTTELDKIVSADDLPSFKALCISLLAAMNAVQLHGALHYRTLAILNGKVTVLTLKEWTDTKYGSFKQPAIFIGNRLVFADEVVQNRLFLDTGFFLDQVL
jgi:hypothetical protein